MVATVAGIGIVNYALVRTYGGRGIAVTGFLGGLASSTSVVGTVLDHATGRADSVSYAVAGVLLADAAMALRNLAIAVAFTVAGDAPVLLGVAAPLGALAVAAVAVAAATADWRTRVDLDIQSPFSLRNALAFGGAFLVILVVSSLAQARFGTAGLYASAAVSGLVSSASATTSAVLLYRGGTVGADAATVAVLLATVSSVGVKAALAFAGPRAFVRRVAVYSLALVAGAAAVALAMTVA
jgi:uncharacterized membrane protein (DUF4010 family)